MTFFLILLASDLAFKLHYFLYGQHVKSASYFFFPSSSVLLPVPFICDLHQKNANWLMSYCCRSSLEFPFRWWHKPLDSQMFKPITPTLNPAHPPAPPPSRWVQSKFKPIDTRIKHDRWVYKLNIPSSRVPLRLWLKHDQINTFSIDKTCSKNIIF